MIDDETLSLGLGVAAYHLQAGMLAVLVGSNTITIQDAVCALEYAEEAVRRPPSLPEDVKDTASAALAALLTTYRKRH